MEVEENKNKIKVIYWVVALIPVVLLNVSPYLGISFPETIESDETYNALVLGFSLVFIVFLIGIFASFKCWVYAEIIPTKVMAILFLLLYLMIVISMIYFFSRGYVGG